jgi:hypothetical protein
MNDKPTEAEIVEAMRLAIAIRIPDPDKPDGYTAAQAALAAQRAMGLVVVPVDMWKLEAVKDAYAQFLADAGLKNAPSLEHLLPRLIAAAQGKADA